MVLWGPIKEVEEEGHVATATRGKPTGGRDDLVGDTTAAWDSGDGMAGSAEGLHTLGRDLRGRHGSTFEAVFEGVEEDVEEAAGLEAVRVKEVAFKQLAEAVVQWGGRGAALKFSSGVRPPSEGGGPQEVVVDASQDLHHKGGGKAVCLVQFGEKAQAGLLS